jgi:hypothetical protein
MYCGNANELGDASKNPRKSFLFFLTAILKFFLRKQEKGPWNQINWRKGSKAGKAGQLRLVWSVLDGP